jgi:hypothetical protein
MTNLPSPNFSPEQITLMRVALDTAVHPASLCSREGLPGAVADHLQFFFCSRISA